MSNIEYFVSCYHPYCEIGCDDNDTAFAYLKAEEKEKFLKGCREYIKEHPEDYGEEEYSVDDLLAWINMIDKDEWTQRMLEMPDWDAYFKYRGIDPKPLLFIVK